MQRRQRMLLVVLQGRTAFLFSFFFPARVLYLFKIREVERLEYKNRRHCVNTLGLITRGQYSRGARSTAGARLVVKPLQEYDPPPPPILKNIVPETNSWERKTSASAALLTVQHGVCKQSDCRTERDVV